MTIAFAASILLLAGVPGAPAGSAADEVTLRDGKVVLCQVVEDAPRRDLIAIVRRAWAREALPGRLEAWEAAEAPALRRATKVRRARLESWRRERAGGPGDGDRIGPWLDAEIDRPAEAGRSPLMRVALNRTGVRRVVRRPRWTTRLLCLGWRCGIEGVETMPLARLRGALEGRGISAGYRGPASVDHLLPDSLADESTWRLRRAATEVAEEPGLWYVGYGGLVFPESGPVGAGAAASALADVVKDLAGEPRDEPLAAHFRGAAARGRIGLVLCALEMAEDPSGVEVGATLFVRDAAGRWRPAARKTASVRPGDLRPDAGADLAADPQVDAAFRLFEGLGLGAASGEMKARSLQVGEATRIALTRARGSLREQIDALAFPLEPGDAQAPAPGP